MRMVFKKLTDEFLSGDDAAFVPIKTLATTYFSKVYLIGQYVYKKPNI